MTGLIVDKEFIINQSPVGVDLIQLPVRPIRQELPFLRDNYETNLHTIFSFCLTSPAFPRDLFAATRISAPSAVSDWSTRPTL